MLHLRMKTARRTAFIRIAKRSNRAGACCRQNIKSLPALCQCNPYGSSSKQTRHPYPAKGHYPYLFNLCISVFASRRRGIRFRQAYSLTAGFHSKCRESARQARVFWNHTEHPLHIRSSALRKNNSDWIFSLDPLYACMIWQHFCINIRFTHTPRDQLVVLPAKVKARCTVSPIYRVPPDYFVFYSKVSLLGKSTSNCTDFAPFSEKFFPNDFLSLFAGVLFLILR